MGMWLCGPESWPGGMHSRKGWHGGGVSCAARGLSMRMRGVEQEWGKGASTCARAHTMQEELWQSRSSPWRVAGWEAW